MAAATRSRTWIPRSCGSSGAGAADGATAEAFFAFLNRAFSMRRKTLFNNFGREPRIERALASLGLPENARAEALPPMQLYEAFLRCLPPAAGAE